MREILKVLVIDDELYESHLFLEALRDDGFRVSFTRTPSEALDLARSDVFDVIVLDIMMPPGESFDSIETGGGYTTGKSLARELRKLLPGTKLVALTHSKDPDIQSWFTQDDSVAYIEKSSIFYDELPRVLRKVLRQGSEPPEVFIVHGRDRRSLLELKNFLQNKLGFKEPIVLAEKPSRGMTLIEKFEFYAAHAELVFVLLTPDDLGCLDEVNSLVQKRARQNAVFEYGFFVGALRRRGGRVFLLAKGELEIPSDLSGIVRIDITDGVEAAGESIRVELEEFI